MYFYKHKQKKVENQDLYEKKWELSTTLFLIKYCIIFKYL